MRKIILSGLVLAAIATVVMAFRNKSSHIPPPKTKLSRATLQDKIRGGWAGQTIGCTYGGHFEFRYNGIMVPDNIPVHWDNGSIQHWYDSFPGLYDDVYMDLTFVEVFDKYGLKAPVDSFANAVAHASYPLWHANQAARYNVLNGIKAPASGHWMNNPHADDIDFQIEADFAGLMSPGMPNTSSIICDSIGHIMNYGDGWYGGVYVAAMYSLAFVSDDIQWIVTEALKTIPAQSKYRKCMEAVIATHKKHPDDWKQAWAEVARNWNEDLYCPDGYQSDFNIDATVNSAYILIGLLYGGGDFTKTMDISMRCGQDADCNPASAAGILGTMIGYSNIPEKYLQALKVVEDRDFVYTTASLNDLYKMSYEHALQVIRANKGKVGEDAVTISYQSPKAVRLEQGFNSHHPTQKIAVHKLLQHTEPIRFDGKGIVVKGYVEGDQNYAAEVELLIDGKVAKSVSLPASLTTRRNEVAHAFTLPAGNHTATLRWKNPADGVKVNVTEVLVFSHPPAKN
ncbi:ADP-ribosylglycohydrolase family protein [Chitinophaga sp. NPDC101104]|uniref:ADP-ribosylglycohydrolase family protein n=1 Tax=Chitinophaga sp. NPDC101104 TaxID=3390561 RepID=UPI003D0147C9